MNLASAIQRNKHDDYPKLFKMMTSAGNSRTSRSKVNKTLKSLGYTSRQIVTARNCLSDNIDSTEDPDENIIWFYENAYDSDADDASVVEACSNTKNVEVKYTLDDSPDDVMDRQDILKMIERRLRNLSMGQLTHILSIACSDE